MNFLLLIVPPAGKQLTYAIPTDSSADQSRERKYLKETSDTSSTEREHF